MDTSQTVAPQWLMNHVVHADARDLLAELPPECVHLTFTSPPYYNARSYSSYPNYETYLDLLESVFHSVHRVTKSGRFLVVNTSPVIIARADRQRESHRLGIPFDLHARLTKLGWRFIDDVVWRKPEAAARPRNTIFATHRQPLTWKANAVTEYVMVYRKDSHRLIDWNLAQYDSEIRRASLVNSPFETTNIWDITPVGDRVHSAVFPEDLSDRIVSYYSMVGDLVFDPFAGSGTVGVSALRLGRKALLSEVNIDYVQRIQERIGMSIRAVDLAELCAARPRVRLDNNE